MAITQITDHAQRALDLVLSQFEESDRLRGLVEYIGDEIQRAEDLAWDLLDKRILANAVGVILDVFGKIVLADRLNADTDAEYRGVIAVAAAANNSDSSATRVAWVASQLVGVAVRYMWDGPASINLEYETDAGPDSDHVARIDTMIVRSLPGGVSYRLTEGSEIGEAFRFNGGPGWNDGRLGRIVCAEGASE